MPTTSAERHVITGTLVCDILGLTQVLRTIAGRLFVGGHAWWRLMLLAGIFALGATSLFFQRRKYLSGDAQRPVWRGMWWVESAVRTAILTSLIAKGDQSDLPRQTTFALWEALLFSVVNTFCRVWVFLRGFTMVELTIQERTALGAQVLVFLPMFAGAVIFHFTEGFTFDVAWNFANHTALTVGFGNIRVTSLAGKVVLITFGNVMLASVAFFLLAIRNVFPAVRSSKAVFALAAGLVVYWLLGSLAFSLIEGWNYLDGAYFTWASLTTIGFGDFHPVTAAGSEFWLIYTYVAVCLYGMILSAASHAIQRKNVADSFPANAPGAGDTEIDCIGPTSDLSEPP